MTAEEARSRRDAHERLRTGFVGHLGPRLLELGGLLDGDVREETRALVSHELDRAGDTAHALGLDRLGALARTAAARLRQAGGPSELRALAAALREVRGRGAVGALLVVARGPAADRLRAAAPRVAEPLRVLPRSGALLQELHVERPDAVVLPAAHTVTIARVAREGFPVLARLDPDRPDLAAAALEAGARGLVPAQGGLDALLRAVRSLPREDDPLPFALVVGATATGRRDLLDALTRAGAEAAAAPVDELLPALEELLPELLVLGPALDAARALDAVRLLRAHPAGRRAVVATLRPAPEAAALIAAGADEVLADGDAEAFAARIEARLRRPLPSPRDPATGLPRRADTLAAFDRCVLHAECRGEPLAALLLRLEGLDTLRARYGRPGAHAALRALAHEVRASLRVGDPVGWLDASHLVAALPGASLPTALRRVEELRLGLRRAARADHRLALVELEAGVADAEIGTRALLVRAEADLHARRADVSHHG